jgi:hypothetical protein
MSVDGTYKVEIDTPMGKQEAKITLKTSGNSLSGTMENPMGNASFSGGTVNGSDVSWKAEVSSPMGKLTLAFTGKVNGSDISGEVSIGAFGSSPFKGKRV